MVGRPILDNGYARKLADLTVLFDIHAKQTATTTYPTSRAAIFGAMETLLADIQMVVPGTVDEETDAPNVQLRMCAPVVRRRRI